MTPLVLVWLACSGGDPAAVSPPAPGPSGDEDELDGDEGLFQKVRVQREIEALEAIGYVDGAEPAPARSGVTRRGDVAPGRMLWTSGHAPEAYLMDLDGNVLHTWRKTYEELFPDKLHGEGRGRGYWRRVLPLPDGGLIAVFEAQGLVRLDAASNVVWKLHRAVHHDIKALPDGRLLTLTRRAQVNPKVHATRPILEDYIAILSADGDVLQEVSVLEAVLNSPFADQWKPRKPYGDIFHTNAVWMLDGAWADRIPAWQAGRVLVSIRSWHALVVVDLDTAAAVWTRTGAWQRQHDPRVLDRSLLLFDNLGLGRASRVLEIDPIDGRTLWSYEGTPEDPFFSRFCGASARNPDGSTLITDSWQGRAFEVDRDGTIVWEFISPHRAGEHQELIAVLPEMIRLPPDWGDGWLAPTAPK